MMAWQSQLTQVLPSATAVNVLLELSPGGALMHSCTQQQLQQMVPADLQQELRNLYCALCELLRHFWACFPTTSKALEDKLVRMRETLQRFRMNKLIPFSDKVSSQHYAFTLIGHMDSMIDAANEKFNKWQSRRSQMLLKRT
jgi:transcription initiation factor TFIIH subunit 1